MNDPALNSRPASRRLCGILAVAALLAACAGRVPVLAPPSGGVEAVEGYGSALLQGAEALVKGKFAFLFRRPDLGRVEALDPIGRTAFYIFFRGDLAYFVLPAKKVYAEERPETMMTRFLGVAFLPDEMIRLFCGTWRDAGPGNAWSVETDERGRVARGERESFAFTVLEFFPGGGVPRAIELSGPGMAGRMKVLRLGFNPPPRGEAFDVSFLRAYALKTWDEIMELMDR